MLIWSSKNSVDQMMAVGRVNPIRAGLISMEMEKARTLKRRERRVTWRRLVTCTAVYWGRDITVTVVWPNGKTVNEVIVLGMIFSNLNLFLFSFIHCENCDAKDYILREIFLVLVTEIHTSYVTRRMTLGNFFHSTFVIT